MIEALLRNPLFQDLSRQDVITLVNIGTEITVPAEHVIIRQGEEGDALYAVVTGQAQVLVADQSNGSFLVAELGPGEVFGELALFDRQPRSATVQATEVSTLLKITRDAFIEALTQSASLLSWVLSHLSRRMRESTERMHRREQEHRAQAAEHELIRHRAITYMVTGLAHELNTPLGICVTSASMMENWLASVMAGKKKVDRSLIHDLAEATTLFNENIKRASLLVRSFTEIADLQHPEPMCEFTVQDLLLDLRAILAGMPIGDPLIERVEITDPIMHTCRNHLIRVLVQLLNNVSAHAWQTESAPNTKVEITVTETLLQRIPALCFSIRDFGVGISQADLPHVFDAFFTTGRSRGHKGLGLAVAYNIVTGPLQGQITLSSEPGDGTTALITLPRRPRK